VAGYGDRGKEEGKEEWIEYRYTDEQTGGASDGLWFRAGGRWPRCVNVQQRCWGGGVARQGEKKWRAERALQDGPCHHSTDPALLPPTQSISTRALDASMWVAPRCDSFLRLAIRPILVNLVRLTARRKPTRDPV
jgi:hypothetical protein